jgi:phage RecT family recombinase
MSIDSLKAHVATVAETGETTEETPAANTVAEVAVQSGESNVAAIPDRAAQDAWFAWVKGYRGYWQQLLPAYLSADAFEMSAITAIQNSKNLMNIARHNPQSIVYSLAMCAHFGLMPDGVQAAIVPYGNSAGFIPMYRGYITLLLRHKVVTSVRMKLVREGDTVEYDNGKPAPDDFSHKINLLAEVPAGQADRTPLLAYAYAWLPDGSRSEVVTISRGRAELIRKEYSTAYKNAEREREKRPEDFRKNPRYKDFISPWHGPNDEISEGMWLKSAMRELVKRFDISAPAISELIAADAADSTTGQQVITPARVMKALTAPPEGAEEESEGEIVAE